MIGYIKKDWYVSRKPLLVSIVLIALMTALSYYIRFAFDYGNLTSPEARANIPMCDILFCMLPSILFLFCSLLATIDSVLQDKKAHWNFFLFSTPISNRKIVLLKISECYGLVFAGTALMLVIDGIYGAVFGFRNVRAGCLVLLLICLSTLFLHLISLPFAYRSDSQNAVVGKLLLVTALPSYALLMGWTLTHAEDLTNLSPSADISTLMLQFFREHTPLLLTAAVILLAAATAIAYFGSLSAVQKRQELCGNG